MSDQETLEELARKDELFDRIANLANADAEAKKLNAAYGGEKSDGGAGRIRELLDAWLAGRLGEVPKAFAGYKTQAERELDPDWETYLRLKEKFGE
jgi:hypothetical protein